MEFHVNLYGRGSLTARIYRSLLSAVLDGRLQPGDQLPPTRELAERLVVSRNTVSTAYERLTAEGFLVGRVGSGTFVTDAAHVVMLPPSDVVPAGSRPRTGLTSRTRLTAQTGQTARTGLTPRTGWTYVPTRTTSEQDAMAYDFRVGIPDPSLFPFDTWRRLVTGELRSRANSPGTYAEPAGHRGLRRAITRYVGYSRSVRADAEDVLVTNGAQQALDLIARVLTSPGDVIAVEEPGYPPARALFESLGARVIGVPVDGSGLVVDRLPSKARLVYVTPSHQFPLGTPMSLARRTALLAWAERHDAGLIEDDYDSEFRFSERPLETLHSLDTSDRVLYVGTFSKTLLPSLRIGFVIAPQSLRSALRAARQLSDAHGHVPTQAALARFMDEGQLARHIRRSTRQYAGRHTSIVSTIERDLSDLLELVPSAAGLHVCARLRCGEPAAVETVVAAGAERGIAIDTLGSYCHDSPLQAGFVFGYGALAADRAETGVIALGRLLRQVT